MGRNKKSKRQTIAGSDALYVKNRRVAKRLLDYAAPSRVTAKAADPRDLTSLSVASSEAVLDLLTDFVSLRDWTPKQMTLLCEQMAVARQTLQTLEIRLFSDAIRFELYSPGEGYCLVLISHLDPPIGMQDWTHKELMRAYSSVS